MNSLVEKNRRFKRFAEVIKRKVAEGAGWKPWLGISRLRRRFCQRFGVASTDKYGSFDFGCRGFIRFRVYAAAWGHGSSVSFGRSLGNADYRGSFSNCLQ